VSEYSLTALVRLALRSLARNKALAIGVAALTGVRGFLNGI